MRMPFELFVALRYLFSRRKQTFIYIISIMSILGVALGENRHPAADDSAGFGGQRFQSGQTLAGGNHIVHQKNPLAFHQSGVGTV